MMNLINPISEYYFYGEDGVYCRYYTYDTYEFIKIDCDKSSFYVIDSFLARDKDKLFCLNSNIEIDSSSFEIINRNFARDSEFVYFIGYSKSKHSEKGHIRKLLGSDPHTFKVLNSKYAIDSNQVYYYYFADDDEGYYSFKILSEVDPQSFTLIDSQFIFPDARDNRFLLLNGNLTDEVDFETLVFKARIGEDLLYFSDSTSVFSLILNGYDSEYSIFKIENASPDDFDFTNDFRNTCSVRNSKFGANTPISDDLPF